MSVAPIPRHSPHHSPRREPLSAIVLHADASPRASSTLNYLQSPSSMVSYHRLIDRDGTVYEVVPYNRVAWHAGAAVLDGSPRVNSVAAGISLANRNDGKEPFPEVQVAAALFECVDLCRAHRIPVERITTHALVAIPKGRKSDPLGFDLAAFRTRVALVLMNDEGI